MDLDVIKAVQSGGALVLALVGLIAVVRAFLKGWIVPGHTHERMLRERDEQLERERQETRDWRSMALGSVDTGSRLVELAAKRKAAGYLDVPPPP